MAKSKKPPEAVGGAYTAVPHRVLDSVAFIGATDRAKSLLFALMRQHNGSNNGRLHLVDKWLAEHGWPSKELNAKTRLELIDRGLIVQTKWGGLNAGCNWYGLTWLAITNFVGLDISSSSYYPGAWSVCELKPTARRKPPRKRDTLPDNRGSTTPTTGAVSRLAAPTTGSEKALLNVSTAPTTGNNVSIPIPPCKSSNITKRIVGRVGRSGNPKIPYSEPSSVEVF